MEMATMALSEAPSQTATSEITRRLHTLKCRNKNTQLPRETVTEVLASKKISPFPPQFHRPLHIAALVEMLRNHRDWPTRYCSHSMANFVATLSGFIKR